MNQPLLLSEEGGEQRPAARRGFLRSLIMAPVAALATHKLIMPAQALVTPDDAAARLQRHLDGVEAAMHDLFPGVRVRRWGTALTPTEQAHKRDEFAAGNRAAIAVVAVDAAIDLRGRK